MKFYQKAPSRLLVPRTFLSEVDLSFADRPSYLNALHVRFIVISLHKVESVAGKKEMDMHTHETLHLIYLQVGQG